MWPWEITGSLVKVESGCQPLAVCRKSVNRFNQGQVYDPETDSSCFHNPSDSKNFVFRYWPKGMVRLGTYYIEQSGQKWLDLVELLVICIQSAGKGLILFRKRRYQIVDLNHGTTLFFLLESISESSRIPLRIAGSIVLPFLRGSALATYAGFHPRCKFDHCFVLSEVAIGAIEDPVQPCNWLYYKTQITKFARLLKPHREWRDSILGKFN